jgi:hypothetical protein
MFSKHAKQMLLAGGVILVVLLIARVPVGTALRFAVLLACPLMMVMMMASMGRGGHGDGSRSDSHEPSAGIPADTVNATVPSADQDAPPPDR